MRFFQIFMVSSIETFFFSNAKFLFGISTALFVLLDWGPPRVSTLASAKGISVAIFLDL